MNKSKLLRTLKTKHDQLIMEAYQLKTKKAQAKRYEAARKVRMVAWSALNRLIKENETLVLDRQLFCTGTFGGGGYGMAKGATIKVLNVSIDYFTFSAGDMVFQADLFSGGWTKSSLEAVLSAEKKGA